MVYKYFCCSLRLFKIPGGYELLNFIESASFQRSNAYTLNIIFYKTFQFITVYLPGGMFFETNFWETCTFWLPLRRFSRFRNSIYFKNLNINYDVIGFLLLF